MSRSCRDAHGDFDFGDFDVGRGPSVALGDFDVIERAISPAVRRAPGEQMAALRVRVGERESRLGVALRDTARPVSSVTGKRSIGRESIFWLLWR